MPNSNQPSIFTSRESFAKQPVHAPLVGPHTPTRNQCARSPLRRQSTPDSLPKTALCAATPGLALAGPLHLTLAPCTDSTPTRAVVNGDLGWSASAPRYTLQDCESWPSDESRWASSAPREQHAKPRSASVSHTRTTAYPTELGVPAVATPSSGQKRAVIEAQDDGDGPTSEPAAKRVRFHGPRTRHKLDGSSFAGASAPQQAPQPSSPLFFSHSPRPRPALPPRFSSSEAAARMMSKAWSEENHVKTVSLARGTITTTPPSGLIPGSTPTSVPPRSSLERPVSAQSDGPEASSNGVVRDMGSMLNSIGVIELLEQDERPTFIVDLADSTNYGPKPILHILFANSALRSYAGMQELLSGVAVEDASPGPSTHLQFKSWLLSASVNGESLNVCLPSFVYNGVTWSCSTLRKRLRITSGAFVSTPPAPIQPPKPGVSFREDIDQPAAGLSSGMPSTEPLDYFSGVSIPASLQSIYLGGMGSAQSELAPSIESAGVAPLATVLSNGTDHSQNSHIQIPTMSSDAPSFDWTRLSTTETMPSHIQFARSVDWASTSLGPIETWSSDLRQMCNLIMASPFAAAMYWGPDFVAIYNEAYIPLAGQKHPKLMGQSYCEAWSEIWDDVKDVFASAKSTGEATMKDDDCLFMKRNNYLEETYFSWSIIPIVGRDGSVMGLYNPAFEKTRRKIAERRMLTLREVGERTASARDVKGFWAQVLGSFEFNEYDSPFLLLYSVGDEADSDASSIHSSSLSATRQCTLEGSLGVPEGHVSAPEQIDMRVGTEGFGPVFREVMKTEKPMLLQIGSRDLPEALLEGLRWRGFGDPVRAVVVCPIHPTTGESTLGFLVLGINPRRPYDDDYSLFVQLLSRQLATSLASVVLFEEEIRRGQKAAQLAALDRIELSEQLARRTQEAIDSETKFTRMAEFAPVGMCIAGPDGRITFANDTWYDISRVPKNSSMADKWMDSVNLEDFELVKGLWHDLVVKTKPVSTEFRFKAQWEDRSGNRGDTWVLFSAFPEKYPDGRLKSVFGSITNISQQKWAEGMQTRKMEEAVELKRQQENFIDMTSHEMRNPLSAILQCADEITTTLTKHRLSSERHTLPDEVLASCLDAAQIISLCSQHQKRIVDDILTLSKLDSQLLLVTPVDAQPLAVVQRALKMHEGELQKADIQMRLVVDQSYRDLELDWVRVDPSRVMQVLINLTTNAIKFTGTEKKRTITVTIAASRQRPSDLEHAPVKYFPNRSKRVANFNDRDWGDGELVFISVSVKDTGRGLNPEEKKVLFMRFSQASPRTHVQYGGSGLGLFISRELTELQGGEIGVESEAGKGSTFAFYIAARRCTGPPEIDAAIGHSGKEARSARAVWMPPRINGHEIHTSLPVKVAKGPKKPMVKKVLIVEDNLVNQRVLQNQLRNLGTEVHLANHGGEALEKLRQSTYWTGDDGDGSERIELGVVLMDQEMPVMDGLTCTRKIRELEQLGMLSGHVPIIAVTANARAEQIETALNAGMDDVVSKPFRIPELLPKIEELMERYPTPSRGSP